MGHKTIRLIDLVPAEWFEDAMNSSVWITAYRIMFADKEEVSPARFYDYDKLRVFIIFGSLTYFDAEHIRPVIDNNGDIKLGCIIPKEITTPEGGWLVILQPYIVDGIEKDEYEIKTRAGMYAGLYAALNGRNMAFERVFDNVGQLKDGSTSLSSPTFVNPHVFPVPDMSVDRCKLICQAGKKMESLPLVDRQRLELALHWYEKGIRAMGLDSFINYWVSLETLGMPDTSNVRPLNESLAKSYNLPLRKVTEDFGIGKIFGFRSRILHKGENLSVHQLLLAYMEALFTDILLSHLDMPPEHKAIKVLSDKNFDFNVLLHI